MSALPEEQPSAATIAARAIVAWNRDVFGTFDIVCVSSIVRGVARPGADIDTSKSDRA
jgi:hypothetical protein